ncbi:hypothetical protein QEZ54_19755 [Catellatospora sp. KI3]|uniref:hypothetical protein n=1 Tax=Catellatospora sp. KI3 TaxID=3041620 RepID=UPI002482935E|nr:hypothetical protein [Catellatospora sp. KI3]MDI1463220.1 hypothetical protein [Catellatospora sp. KI3]
MHHSDLPEPPRPDRPRPGAEQLLPQWQVPEPGDRPEPRASLRARLAVAAIVTVVGAVAFVATVLDGRTDSAMVFVGLPTLLAVALTLTSVRNVYGRVTKVVTIVLLLTAVFLHEGFICVVLAAPLVYAVALGVTAVVQAVRRGSRTYALVLPLLLISGGEGLAPEVRVNPQQAAFVVRVLPLTVDQVAARLADGPEPTALRSVTLRMLSMPTPLQVEGDGLDLGDRWMFAYHGSAHGPGGHIVTEITERSAQRVGFGFVEDTTINARWFHWRHAAVTWRAVDAGHTEVTLDIAYERRLDPFWYFGPIQQTLMHAGGEHLLDMLDLR